MSAENGEVKQEVKTKLSAQAKEAQTYTDEEILKIMQSTQGQAIVQAMVAKMLAAQQPTVVVKSDDEMVTLLYMGAVAEGSVVNLGDMGQIMGRGGTIDVPKKAFFQNLKPNVLKRLKDRRLIVIDGLTDAERERYGLVYKEGELLKSNVYYQLLDMDEKEVISIFRKACFRHKQLIAALYADAYSANDNRVNQQLVEKLNAISKETDPDGMFTAILKDMGKKLGDE